MRTAQELAQSVNPILKRIDGMVRRMLVTIASARATWQVSGFRQLDGSTEVRDVEVFGGIGVFARPPGAAEAIVIMVGDAKTPVAIATRDEKTRAAVAGSLAADETALYNSQVIAIAKADGTFEIRSKTGVALPLATKADLDALKAAIAGAPTTGGDGGAAFKAALLAALSAWPVGTLKLRGE